MAVSETKEILPPRSVPLRNVSYKRQTFRSAQTVIITHYEEPIIAGIASGWVEIQKGVYGQHLQHRLRKIAHEQDTTKVDQVWLEFGNGKEADRFIMEYKGTGKLCRIPQEVRHFQLNMEIEMEINYDPHFLLTSSLPGRFTPAKEITAMAMDQPIYFDEYGEYRTCGGQKANEECAHADVRPGTASVEPDVVKELTLKFTKLTDKASVPTRGSHKAAGIDLYSAYDLVIPTRGRGMVKTDIQIALPEGCYGRIAPRSGLAIMNGINVGAGVIDPDFRGNVGVILFNLSDADFKIKRGDRIAQLILEKIYFPKIIECNRLDSTARGKSGFGSTGIRKKRE